ncbi:MAG: hypothetical protein DI566_08580 [Microbacterium sp.]|nr:MAG: hypothetical protein DI566_08580 [Microbacterium sp.]
MTREVALLIMVALALVLIVLGAFAWAKRRRRDSGLRAPLGDIPADAVTTAVASGFYVATTRRDEPLERLAIRGLGFRSRAGVTVTNAGVGLDLTGAASLFIPIAAIDGVDLASVAIDRAVEPGGLVRLAWRADGSEPVPVDSYLRPQDTSARALADAIAATLAPTHTSTTPTGTDA